MIAMKKLTLFSLFLAAVVIILGAYTRLTDAGLGCPDWPGCYGNLTVPLSEDKVAQANAAYPERPVEAFKAWNEMIHRYFAGTLGLCVLAIAVIAIRQRKTGTPLRLPLLLLALIIFQAALGMWTVTLNLLPVVVMGHLLGGFTVISCLFVLYLRLRERDNADQAADGSLSTMPQTLQHKLRLFACVGVAVLVTQIALGGWTSANYAALACTEMPICESGWQARLDFAGAYSVPDADNYEFGAHDYGERVTMHIVHRVGALITFAYLVALGVSILASKATSSMQKRIGVVMLAALTAQVALGVSNVVFMLPLAVAVLHNAVAAFLLLSLLYLVFTLYRHNSTVSVGQQDGGERRYSQGVSDSAIPSASFTAHSLTKAPGGFHG
jgi:cytochrome c oxidase assembly protein subunit 15